jgi:hypothetical protein
MNEILKLKCGVGGGEALPVGTYDLAIVGVESTQTKFGDALKWLIEVVGPAEHAGKRTQKVGSAKPTPKNWSGKIISAAIGRPVEDEEIDLKADVFGKAFVGIVGPQTITGEDGKPTSANVLAMVYPKPKQ